MVGFDENSVLNGPFSVDIGSFSWVIIFFNWVETTILLQHHCCKNPASVETCFFRDDESKDMTVRTSNSRLVC